MSLKTQYFSVFNIVNRLTRSEAINKNAIIYIYINS